jgi:hypothetical protein
VRGGETHRRFSGRALVICPKHRLANFDRPTALPIFNCKRHGSGKRILL